MISRVEYIIDTILPSDKANGVHVARMCSALAGKIKNLELIIPDVPANKNSDQIRSYYKIQNSFQLKKLKPIFPFAKRTFFALKAARRALNRKDIVVTRTLEVAFFCHAFRVPFLFEMHSPYLDQPFYKHSMLNILFSSEALLKVIVISDCLKKIISSHYQVAQEKITVLHDCADIIEEPLDALVKGNTFKLGYAGSLFNGRGIDVIIELARKYPALEFHVVGGSPEQLGKWKAHTQSNIVWHGSLTPFLVPGFLSSMNILLAPYQRSVEVSGGGDTVSWMSPLKVFEYMATGVPMIVSDLPVLREVLVDRENCLLINPESLSDWGNAIEEIIRNPELGKSLAKSARVEIVTKYNWNKRAEKFSDIISEYLHEKHTA
jgi:glycosyltransferase involved in cell wall biosynthesis